LTQKQPEPYDIPLKKTKMDESQLSLYLREHMYPAQLLYQFSQLSRQQAPWPTTASSPKNLIFGQNIGSIPYLPSSQEPPILQNPERVVRHTENERFDRSYQPNVALAPRQTILTKEREERDHNERSNSVIKREIQIKQERPSTPNNEHSESRHNSPETTENNVGASVPPISPDQGQSGSNEITSSTSPVPASNNNIHHHHQIPNKRESETPPSQPSPTAARSHTTTTTLIKTSPSVVVKVTTHSTQPIINGKIKTTPPIGNPEFELSTDTDDESFGEPDSSHNGNPPQSLYEFVASLLKTNSNDDHSKILNIIKYMEKEITQLKEAHKKEIREILHREGALQKENERLQHQLRNNNVSSVIAATASCLSSSSSSSSSSLSSNYSFDYERGERRNSIIEKQNVIIKPPKKSLSSRIIIDDSRPISVSNHNNSSTSTSNNNNNSQLPSIVIMPKSCEDAINNNSSKAYNNNSSNNDSVSNSSSTNIINGNQTDCSMNEKQQQQQQLQKTAVKTEKL
jgi:hypothetical protein